MLNIFSSYTFAKKILSHPLLKRVALFICINGSIHATRWLSNCELLALFKRNIQNSELIGTDKHYVGVKIKIEHQALANPKENHPFDLDDFKLKNHTGVQLKNINFFSKEDGLALETTDFTTRQPIKDYTWYGKSVESGEVTNIELYKGDLCKLFSFEYCVSDKFDDK